MSIANNHINDFGIYGRKSTIDVLDKLNIGWSGPPKTYAEVEISDINIVFIAFCPYDHSNDLRKIDQSKKIIQNLSKKFDVIIVSFTEELKVRMLFEFLTLLNIIMKKIVVI